jgi:hypothetical protein
LYRELDEGQARIEEGGGSHLLVHLAQEKFGYVLG